MFKALMGVRLAAIKNWLLVSARTSRGKSATKGKVFFIAFILLYAFGAFGFMIYGFFSQLSGPYYAAGLGWLYFALFALTDFALIFLGSVFAVKAQLFDAKDNDLLLAMPVPPTQILASRMLALLGINYFFSLITTVPAALAWARSCPVTPLSAVAFVILALLIPFLALAVSALFAWLLSILTRRARHKSLLTTVFSLVFLALYFVVIGQANTAVAKMVLNGGAIAENVRAALPLWWMGNAIAEENLLYLLNAALVCIVPFAVAYTVLAGTFIKTVTTKRGSARIAYVEREQKAASAFSALYRRELQRFFSSSIYVMNAGLGAIFLLIAGVAIVIKQGAVRELVKTMPGIGPFLTPVLILGLCLISAMAMISAPSVSMEGKNIWIVRSLPVATQDILKAKLLVHISLAGPASVIGGIGAAIASQASLPDAVMCILIPFAFTVLTALVGLMANLQHANLDWMNETQAVKNSAAVIITMGLMLLAAAAIGGAFYGLVQLGLSAFLSLLLLLVVLVVVCRSIYAWILSRGAALFEML